MAKLTITLYQSELVYDVQNKSYLTGRSRNSGNNFEEVANMQANMDEEELNQISRSVQAAFSKLKTKLSEYVTTEVGSTDITSNDVLAPYDPTSQTAQTYTLELNHLPSNFNAAIKDSLTASVHDYIVNRALGEWFVITNKADASDYFTAAENNVNEIRETINKRVRPTRTAIPTSNGTGAL